MRKNLILLGAAVTLCLGCGETMPASVSGKASIDGQPLTSGKVAFHPIGAGTIAYGTINSSGNYQLSTGTTPGIAPGEYTATVVVNGPMPDYGPTAPVPAAPLLSPVKYASKQSSDLRFSVNQGSNTINLELKSR